MRALKILLNEKTIVKEIDDESASQLNNMLKVRLEEAIAKANADLPTAYNVDAGSLDESSVAAIFALLGLDPNNITEDNIISKILPEEYGLSTDDKDP
jgi:hypothetical protein